jgi:hypothetical protein
MDGKFKLWEIREEEAYRESKNKLRHSTKRLDEVLFGVMWVLARRPDSFPKIPGLQLYVAKTDRFSTNPALYIWYTFDSKTVSLLLIEEAPQSE